MTTRERPYWKDHYVVGTDPDAIERSLGRARFKSRDGEHELLVFERGAGAPNVLISPGSGGHAYVFAELAYLIQLHGYNTFVMPRHGGAALPALIDRHADAARHIARRYGERIGVFGEGLGGYAVFYLALARGPVRSIACQNAPAICTEPAFREAVMGGHGAALRRRLALPLLLLAVKVAPKMPVPISFYLDFRELIDAEEENRRVEAPLVAAYRRDPDFDTRYPLDAVLSLVTTPPPAPLSELATPTMFIVPARGVAPAYVKDLYGRLPPVRRRLIEVDDGVFWMCSHPREAAGAIAAWFDETL